MNSVNVITVAFVLHVVLVFACYVTGYAWIGWMASFCAVVVVVFALITFFGKEGVEVCAKDE